MRRAALAPSGLKRYSLPMKATIEGYDEIREKMKGVRLPSRRRLAREPWDEEQRRIFCMRQSRITEHWARLGLSGFKELWLQPDGSYSEEVPERYRSCAGA